jgi:hypothetical protein
MILSEFKNLRTQKLKITLFYFHEIQFLFLSLMNLYASINTF